MSNRTSQVSIPMEPRRIGTVTTVMEYAQVGRNTVYRAIARGDIRAYKSGRILRVDLDSVDAWLRPVDGGRA